MRTPSRRAPRPVVVGAPGLCARAGEQAVADAERPRTRRRTCTTASSRSRSTRTWGPCLLPSTRFACCRYTRLTSWSGACRAHRVQPPCMIRSLWRGKCNGLWTKPVLRRRYHENGALGQPPHTYAIADNAYRNLIRDWKAWLTCSHQNWAEARAPGGHGGRQPGR